MPLYNYLCADCGPFDEIRSMSAYEEPEPCPQCGDPAPRQLGAPAVNSASPSAGAPRAPAGRSLRHRGGCGCCSSAVRRPAKAEAISAAALKQARNKAASPVGSFLTRA
jgi:putative FmdB family regulatory protein